MLVDLFTAPLQALPLENAASPVTEAKVDQSGTPIDDRSTARATQPFLLPYRLRSSLVMCVAAKFAFVLFADDQLATMALALFNKMELCGRPMCVDRPAGYTPDMSTPLPPGLMASGMPQGGLGAPPEKAAAAAAVTAAAAASRAKPQVRIAPQQKIARAPTPPPRAHQRVAVGCAGEATADSARARADSCSAAGRGANAYASFVSDERTHREGHERPTGAQRLRGGYSS